MKHLLFMAILLVGLPQVHAAELTLEDVNLRTNNTWMLVATFMVFIMHLGFATLETGLTRSKNTVNILFKNSGVLAIGLMTYAICGFNLMYPDFTDSTNKFFDFAGWGIAPPEGYDPLTYANGNYTYWTDFLFQAMFAATCATIVSGAVAERVKLGSFLIFSAIFVGFFYPWLGSWKWGGGWLEDKGFHDFAGSTLVHSVGGWAALAGVIMVGPRIGKYVNGAVKPIMGHNLPLAAIGVFLLWFGWYGFNGGSVLSAEADTVSRVFVTTSLSAAAGVLSAIAVSWIHSRKPDLTMALNGSLAGLVGVTAGADVVSVMDAVVIGLVSGVIVVFGVSFFDKLKLDDPVGALSVHLLCGVWGTIAVGIFSPETVSVGIQLLGAVAYAVVSFLSALLIFAVLKHTIGIRVSEEEELGGLDIGEHGMEAYNGFQIFITQ
ncbi:ammonium transporter [Kiritimatiellaeota bacterium B1221]|nr:ammonium transporter [Kiritimatiellaeota bacterium B1221]